VRSLARGVALIESRGFARRARPWSSSHRQSPLKVIDP